MSAKHTPGPWLVNAVCAQVEVPHADAPICALLWPTSLRSEEETEANARLIAAAPEMLDELQKAHALLILALKHMTPGGQAQFAKESEQRNLGTDGATRHHERAAVLSRARGEPASSGVDQAPHASTSEQDARSLQQETAKTHLSVAAGDLEANPNALLVGVVDPLPKAVDEASSRDQQNAGIGHLQGHSQGQDHHAAAHHQQGLVPVVDGQALQQFAHRIPPLYRAFTAPSLCDEVGAALAGTGPEVILHGASVELTVQKAGAKDGA